MSSLLHPHSPFRIFAISASISIIALGYVFFDIGWQAALIAFMLVIIELTFSFDNAIINARILMTMSPFWQKMFMTVGIFIAVFGMRIVFPIVIVMMSAGLLVVVNGTESGTPLALVQVAPKFVVCM